MIRRARPSDVPQIVELVQELAEYERARHEAQGTLEQFTAALFGPEPKVFAHVIDGTGEEPAADGRLSGYAIWFLNFSTWLGVHGLYLEDLYVRPEVRGHGLGKAVLSTLAAECVEKGYGRLEWWVLDWNRPAWDFYASQGAIPMDEWTVHRVTGDALRTLAAPPTAT